MVSPQKQMVPYLLPSCVHSDLPSSSITAHVIPGPGCDFSPVVYAEPTSTDPETPWGYGAAWVTKVSYCAQTLNITYLGAPAGCGWQADPERPFRALSNAGRPSIP